MRSERERMQVPLNIGLPHPIFALYGVGMARQVPVDGRLLPGEEV